MFAALAVGIPVFIVVLVGPLVLLSGLLEVFLSSVWTLTYRELPPAAAREREPALVPGLDVSGLEAARAA